MAAHYNWSIDTALACEEIDAVVVSTDDQQTAAVAAAAGAEVPFFRPPNLASDSASSIDVVLHALNFLERKGQVFDIVLLLEPTSPLREDDDIQEALRRLRDMDASAIVSVCRVESSHPAFMFHITKNNRLDPFLSVAPTGLRRQEIESLFYLDGSLYASTVSSLESNAPSITMIRWLTRFPNGRR